MNRIITGGTGLIGRHLISHWLSQGHTIKVIGRSEKKITALFQDKVEFLSWDDLKPQVFQNADLVVNLAGAGIADGRWTEARKQEIINSRIEGTRKIVSHLTQLKGVSPALFNASAIGIYGLQNQLSTGLPPALDEDTSIQWNAAPDFASQVARLWEKETHPARDQGIRVVNLRFGVVLAKDGGALRRIVLPFRFFMGGPIGSGQQPFTWIAIDDLIRAIDFLISKPEMTGPVNLVSPQAVTQKECAKAIGRVLHRPALMPIPAFALRLVFGEMARELLLEGQHVYPKRLLGQGFQFSFSDIEAALGNIYRK